MDVPSNDRHFHDQFICWQWMVKHTSLLTCRGWVRQIVWGWWCIFWIYSICYTLERANGEEFAAGSSTIFIRLIYPIKVKIIKSQRCWMGWHECRCRRLAWESAWHWVGNHTRTKKGCKEWKRFIFLQISILRRIY